MRSSVSIRDNDADISNRGAAKIYNGEDSKFHRDEDAWVLLEK